jgi:GTP pyrophosphokinase
MFADEVFVFSPKGDVINLPAGATPIDFAYSIHSGVGNSMVGASVNGRIVTFDHVLQNGDIVEIRTSKSAPGPSRDWLNMAKERLRPHEDKAVVQKRAREDNITTGREMFEAELRSQGLRRRLYRRRIPAPAFEARFLLHHLDDLYAAIGYGGITATKAVNRMHDELIRNQRLGDKKTVLDKVNEAAERRTQQSQRCSPSPSTACWWRGWTTALSNFPAAAPPYRGTT